MYAICIDVNGKGCVRDVGGGKPINQAGICLALFRPD